MKSSTSMAVRVWVLSVPDARVVATFDTANSSGASSTVRKS